LTLNSVSLEPAAGQISLKPCGFADEALERLSPDQRALLSTTQIAD